MTDNQNPPSSGQVIQSVGCLIMGGIAFVFFAMLLIALIAGGD